MRSQKKKRKIAIITGSRGEYGYYRPIIKGIKRNPNLDYGIIATNMHVLDTFGHSVNEIKRDKLKIHGTVHNTLDGYNALTMVKSLAIFNLQLPELLTQMGADMILLAGDRGEQLIGAIVGAHMYIPTAHIQAGEVSGNIDGMTRHAITKFAHIHFAANKDAADRVRKMGEEEHRIFAVGAPQLDELVDKEITARKEILSKFCLNKNEPTIMFVYHPVTEEFDDMERQTTAAIDAVASTNYQTVVVMSNSDSGSNIVRRVISERRTPNMKLYNNLPRKDYLGLLSNADVFVGNSSSGIIESPVMKTASVNIGNRQKNRARSTNVIDVAHNQELIEKAIRKALTPSFQKRVQSCKSPYGDGKSSKRILDVLENIEIDDTLLTKSITY